MSVLDPFVHALAAVFAATHSGLAKVGADPASVGRWILCIATVVVVVRIVLLPLVAHGVRLAHASARARPRLQELTKRYRHRRDADSLRAFAEERRRIAAEHGLSRVGCLPLLVQLPIWMSLYHLVSDVSGGTAVGAMSAGLVASLGAAALLGVPLAQRGYLGGGWAHFAVVAGLAVVAAVLSYGTQKYLVAPNTVVDGLPDAMARTQQLMPAISAAGLLVAGGVVPVALLVYWVCNSLWTLGQSAVIYRWFPTPGSPAAVMRD